MRFSTKAIRVGQEPDASSGAVITPVCQTANFVFQDVGKPSAYEYSRSGNPTRTALERCLASLEEGRFAMAFASGMAAVEAVLSLLKPGDHVVSSSHIYGGTLRLFQAVHRPRGVEFTFADATDSESFRSAVTGRTKLIWIETPANPLLQLVDVRAVSKIAADGGALLVADNTFASPFFQRPLTQGADIVLHSTTKYINGHSDVIGGAVVVNSDHLHEQIRFYQNAAGAVPGPWDCWLSLRGLKTLAIRMQRHEQNAQAVAEFLESHPRAQHVTYPGLASHPQHALAKAQMDGFGGIVTFELQGGREAVRQFVKGLNVFLFAESLGGVESLVCHPATMSHAVMSEQERHQAGITDGMIRLSVGIEDVEDIIEDLSMALSRVT